MTTASDDFTRAADEVPAASPWLSVNVTGDIVGGARIDSTFDYLWAGGGSTRVSLYDGGTSWADDQTADAVVGALSAGSSYSIVVARFVVGGNGYAVDTDGPTSTIYRVSSGTFTTLKSSTTTFANGDTIGIRTAGSTIYLRKNGTDVDSTTDGTYTTGRPGAGAFGNATIDNWSASDVGAPVIEQEGFRFGVDNGAENAHTWSAAQDTNTTLVPGNTVLINFSLNLTGNPGNKRFALQYRKVGDALWIFAPIE